MKLTYTEFRPSVNTTEVEELAVVEESTDFRDAIVAEIKTCLDNYSYELAHKLLDWHNQVEASGLKPGAKLVHNYGGGRDGVGTYELTK
jgi:hypothetical protein